MTNVRIKHKLVKKIMKTKRMNNQQELMKEHESCEFHLVTIAEIIIMQMKPGAMRNEK